MSEPRHTRGLIDTSVVIDLDRLDPADLPREMALSVITLAELAAGPSTAGSTAERARREATLQLAEVAFSALPFTMAAARAYGQITAAVVAGGRKPRGRRAMDLLIAATALAAGLPLYTRNPDDFTDLLEIIEVIGV